jgi:hypothetical protein
MGMCGVARQEHATVTIAVGKARIHAKSRCPEYFFNDNIRPAGAGRDHRRQALRRKIDLPSSGIGP